MCSDAYDQSGMSGIRKSSRSYGRDGKRHEHEKNEDMKGERDNHEADTNTGKKCMERKNKQEKDERNRQLREEYRTSAHDSSAAERCQADEMLSKSDGASAAPRPIW